MFSKQPTIGKRLSDQGYATFGKAVFVTAAVVAMSAFAAGPPCSKCVNGKPPHCGTEGCLAIDHPFEIGGSTAKSEKTTVYTINYTKSTSLQLEADINGVAICADITLYRLPLCISKISNVISEVATNSCNGNNPYTGETDCSQVYPGAD
jgi:hypothetical protein